MVILCFRNRNDAKHSGSAYYHIFFLSPISLHAYSMIRCDYITLRLQKQLNVTSYTFERTDKLVIFLAPIIITINIIIILLYYYIIIININI